MRLISWNVNGIRAIMKKGFQESLQLLNADVLCLQETKAQDDQVDEALAKIDGYHLYSNSAKKKGYSGTAILSKIKPLHVQTDIGIEEHDKEGRVIMAEYEDYHLVNVYVPNAGQGMVRLDYRKKWDKDFLKYLKNLEKTKPVIVCGDFNVAHRAIDLANPKSNYNKSSGYTQIEIDGMTSFQESGLIDTFRMLYPEEVTYSWWSYRFSARARNIGWRIDYFLISESMKGRLDDSFILPEYLGSDHCPVGVNMG